MISFDAIGRLAVGQIDQAGPKYISLAALPGAFSIAGTATFSLGLLAAPGSYSVNGVPAPLQTRMPGASTSYATAVSAASFSSRLDGLQASYIVNGIDAALGAGGLPAANGSFSVAGNPAFFYVFASAEAGSMNVTGVSANFALGLEDWVPVIGTDEIWTPTGTDADIWTPAVKQDEAWSMSA